MPARGPTKPESCPQRHSNARSAQYNKLRVTPRVARAKESIFESTTATAKGSEHYGGESSARITASGSRYGHGRGPMLGKSLRERERFKRTTVMASGLE